METAVNVVKCCLLPSLRVKIGEQQITREQFQKFQPILRDNLRALLDIVLANEYDLLQIDVSTLEFRTLLCLALCEQVSPSVFQIEDSNLQIGVLNLTQKVFSTLLVDDDLITAIMDNYGKKLREWKLNIGSVYGFPEFCNRAFEDKELNSERANFVLAVSLNFLDHFESHIQLLGLRIFKVLLNEKNSSLTKSLNIEQVILKEASKITTKSTDVEFISELWNVLFKCYRLTETDNTSKWSCFDDLFEELMTRLGFESDKTLTILYLCYLNKFLSPKLETLFDPIKVRNIINVAEKSGNKQQLDEWFEHMEFKEPNYRCYRWIKKLMILIQNEMFKLGGNNETLLIHLNVCQLLHVCFLQTIGTTSTTAINLGERLVEFLIKTTTTLTEVVQIYAGHPTLVAETVYHFHLTIKNFLSPRKPTNINETNIFTVKQDESSSLALQSFQHSHDKIMENLKLRIPLNEEEQHNIFNSHKFFEIKKRLLSCCPLGEDLIKDIVVKLEWDEQKEFLHRTLFDSQLLMFPIKKSSQIAFLKKVINIIESSIGEVHDDIYEVFCSLKNSHAESEFIYKHHLLDSKSQRIIIKEANSIISNGTTGLVTWEAGIQLVDFLTNSETLVDKHVLELGSGIGFVGLMIHALIRPRNVLLTDCHEKVLELLKENIRINECPTEEINATRLLWGREDLPSSISIPDFIIGSDLVYDETLFVPLLETVEVVFEKNTACQFILAATVRNEETLTKFIDLAKDKFSVQELPYTASERFAHLIKPGVLVKMFKLTRRLEDLQTKE